MEMEMSYHGRESATATSLSFRRRREEKRRENSEEGDGETAIKP